MANNNILDIYELSPLQHGMLFHTLKHPGMGVYVVQLACRMDGPLNLAIFQDAWQKLLTRHSIFRTGFYWKEADKPLQVVYKAEAVVPHWTILDWRGRSPAEQQAALGEFLQQDREKDFTLAKPPLMRFALLQVAEESHYFVWSYHHLLLDGWSLSQVLRELFIYYETLLNKELYPMPVAPPYREYISWLQQQSQEAAMGFWKKMLGTFAAPTPLVIQKQPPLASDADRVIPGEVQLELDETLTTRLQRLAQQHQLTLSTLLQGAWGLLLGRYAGEPDAVFGSVVSGRPASLPGVETIVGPFINTLPVRVRLDEEMAVLPWLQALHQQLAEMREYEYSALVDIQQQSGVPRGQPLFESSFVLENYPLEDSVQDERLSLKISELQDLEQTNFALGLLVLPGERLLLKLAYDTHRFEARVVTNMLGHLATLLSGMAEDVGRPLGSLPLLTPQESEQLLAEWSQAAAPYEAQPIHRLFEAQAARTPEAIAVRFEDKTLSYEALNRQANRLAHYLRSVGVGAETLVGIHMERSPEMIVAILGILKAGGAYVPLDPAYPQARLDFILGELQQPPILTMKALAERLGEYPGQLIPLDTQRLTLARFSTETLEAEVAPDHLAYVIYTSGSTGTPKGTLLTHRGVAALAAFQRETLGIGPGSQVLQFASLNFDGAVWEILPPLCLGATIHLARLETIMALPTLVELMEAQQINMATLPPSVLALMPPAALPHLHTLFSAGEACTPEVAERWATGRRFFNGYGPTEATVGLTFAQLDGSEATTPIGRPFPNKEIYVLDKQMRPVPVGVPGELYAGGVGLARGYLHQAALTAEKFVPHPFSRTPGARLYRTGDLVRFLPDGRLEFLGRLDNQVKLRGFRIELGEIENRLRSHPDVAEALVVLHESAPNHKQLVGYYRTVGGREVEAPELRESLRAHLPGHMIPAALMRLESFPLTVNGKVDRHALPAPQVQRGRQEVVPPSTELEQSIAAIWQALLGVEMLSVEDNFFDLGGHSLLMLQVNRRLQQALGREVALVDLFQHPTIQSLARHLSRAQEDTLLDEVQERTQKQRAALAQQRQQMQRR